VAAAGVGKVTFDRAATMRMGKGDDQLNVGKPGAPAVFAYFRGHALFDGGPGTDTLQRLAGGNDFDAGLTEANWESIA
jgi:hypothetical protein